MPAMPARDYSQTTDAQFCAEARRLSAGMMAELPVMVDTVTRMDGMSVICSLRSVAWNKFVMVEMSSLREGWQGRKQSQFNAIICGNEAFRPMARRGWRFVQNLTFQSGERVTQEASC